MTRKIVRSEACLNDLTRIWDYLADRSLGAADRIIERINDRIDELPNFPDVGEAQPRFGPSCRQVIVGNYVVYYDAHVESIEVLRVLHAARRMEDLL